VAGEEPNSRKARDTVRHLCETRLKGRATVEVVDVLEDFQAAIENNVLVAPTLIIAPPEPPITIIGSLRDVRKVLEALGLPEEGEDA